jgi:DNA-binding LacI/PurR family transcriptional regulator
MSTTADRTYKHGIRAVAAHAGVSIATVSRTLNNPDLVRAELRARVAQAIDSVGYIPHAPARSLSTRRSRTLGAIVPTIDNTMFERSGFSVPYDLSVVGFDDLDWSRHLRPSLTTIQVPTASTWQRAGEFLVRHLAGEQTIIHHEVDYALIVRESTAPPPLSSKRNA